MYDRHNDLISRVAEALRHDGWHSGASHRGIEFTRDELVRRGTFRITLLFDPGRMHLPPSAHVERIDGEPDDFHWHRIGQLFCHIDTETIEWDCESPTFEGNVLFIARRAIDEFHRLQKGAEIHAEDLEFAVHWQGQKCYLDAPNETWPPAQLECIEISPPETEQILHIYRTHDATPRYRYAAFTISALHGPFETSIIHLERPPRPTPDNWPPTTLSQLNRFIDASKPKNRKNAFDTIAKTLHSKSCVLLLLDTAVGQFGVVLTASAQLLRGFRRQRLPETLRGQNRLTRHIQADRIAFSAIDETCFSARIEHSRQPLRDYNIDLVGVGAVGSVLADRLVQAGAGSGHGRLRIIDMDTLEPENLGRHLLGFPYLGMNKATAVIGHLRRHRLIQTIQAHTQPWRDPDLHADTDLVIDATAKPMIGAALSNDARRNRRFALILASVEGEGWNAGAFLYRGVAGEACRTCMEPWPGGWGSNIQKGHSPQRRDNGCGGTYVPFRASSADLAAGLACDLACDWASGLSGKTYRTIRFPGAPTYVRRDRYETPKSKSGCICSR